MTKIDDKHARKARKRHDMKIDEKRTREAQKRHHIGVIKLNVVFRVTPAVLDACALPRPKKRGGLAKNRVRVLRRRRRHLQRAMLRSAHLYEKHGLSQPKKAKKKKTKARA